MSKRFNNLAIYRVIAALAIIEFHILFITSDSAIPYETLLSKAVQGFTALSGLLYAGKRIENPRAFILGALKKLVIPALACFAFMAAWNLVYMLSTGATDYIALFFDRRVYNGALLVQPGNYYYVLFIFICYAITPLLKSRHKLKTVVIAAIAEVLLSFFFGLSIIIIPYIVGYLIGERSFDRYTNTEYRIAPIVTWLILTALSLCGYALLVSVTPPCAYIIERLYTLGKGITSAAFGTASFFLMIYLLKGLNRFDEPKILLYTDRLGLTIFLMNQAFLCGAMDLSGVFDSPILNTLTVYVATIGSAMLIDAALSLLTKVKKKA
jgi:peptidoglycan/LPS O-acetylase OafA/YrhL